MTPLEELKQLYYQATRATMARDFARAIALFKALPDEETRERAAVFMDGLAQMRSEWGIAAAARPAAGRRPASGAPGRPRRSRG